MPTSTYVALGTITLASTDSEIVFSSIPATYRDLILIVNGSLGSSAGLRMQLNSDTGANYNQVAMKGAASATSEAFTGETVFYPSTAGLSSGQRFDFIGQFLDYSVTDKHKAMLFREGHNGSYVEASAARWASTSAITSIKFYPSSGSFNIGSTFSLYGVN